MHHGGPPGGYPPPPPYSEGPPGGYHPQPPHGGPEPPEHHAHPGPGYETSHASAVSPQIKGQVVKIFSEAGSGFNLGVHGDTVVIVKANDSDPHQQWIKDESWSNKAKDSAGHPAFSLVNKGSGKALSHPRKEEEKVHVTVYHQNSLNEEVLWSSSDVGHGWHAIRSVSNIKLNLDIDHGSKKYGGIHDGQSVIVFTWKDEPNQHWKMSPISTTPTTSHDHHHTTSHDHHHRW